jgi:hypothetical protein
MSRNLSLDRKISMNVHLYFPDLVEATNTVFAVNQEMVSVFRGLSAASPIRPVDVARATLKMVLALKSFEREIIDNRSILVRARLRPISCKKINAPTSVQAPADRANVYETLRFDVDVVSEAQLTPCN